MHAFLEAESVHLKRSNSAASPHAHTPLKHAQVAGWYVGTSQASPGHGKQKTQRCKGWAGALPIDYFIDYSAGLDFVPTWAARAAAAPIAPPLTSAAADMGSRAAAAAAPAAVPTCKARAAAGDWR